MNTNTNLANLARAYAEAKEMLKMAKANTDRLQGEIFAAMGEDKMTVDGWNLTATRGKTRKVLSAELIEKILGVKITDDCYTVSKPWDELRVSAAK